jgi:AcrR family transcriptional regulator
MPGQPRTGRGRASRERIVERAADLFAERGVAGTSLDEVLAAAGAGKSQLYHYFHGRDELVEAAVAAAARIRTSTSPFLATGLLTSLSSRTSGEPYSS